MTYRDLIQEVVVVVVVYFKDFLFDLKKVSKGIFGYSLRILSYVSNLGFFVTKYIIIGGVSMIFSI